MQINHLESLFSTQKSFNGKAVVLKDGEVEKLFSYDTHVATFDGRLVIHGTHSATTIRHLKEYAAQKCYGMLSTRELNQFIEAV